LVLFALACASQSITPNHLLEFSGPVDEAQVFLKSGKFLWIGAKNGLFRYIKGSGMAPERVGPALDQVYSLALSKSGDTLWIRSQQGLFRYRVGSTSQPELIPTDIGFLTFILQSGSADALWIGGSYGLLRYDERTGTSVHVKLPIVSINALVESKSGELWIGTDEGFYRYRPVTDASPMLIGGVRDEKFMFASQSSETLWLVAEAGGSTRSLLRYRFNLDQPVGELVPREDSDGITFILESKVSDSLWIATRDGLFKYRTDSTAPPIRLTAADTGQIYTMIESESGDYLWISAAKGIFRYKTRSGSLESSQLKFSRDVRLFDSWDNEFYCVTAGFDDKKAWISEFFVIKGWHQTTWNAQVQFTDDTDAEPPVGKATTIRWIIRNYDHRTTPDIVKQRVLLYDWRDRKVDLVDGGKPRRLDDGGFEYTLPALQSRHYYVAIESEDIVGNISTSKKLELIVGKSSVQRLEKLGKVGGLVYAAASLLGFLILIVGSRWSKKCFDILADPLVRTLSIYYGFLLTRVRFIRIWVFERYFDELKAAFPIDPGPEIAEDIQDFRYLPSPICGDHDFVCLTTEFDRWLLKYQRVWIKGGPGTGKSEAIRALVYAYTRKSSLREAWKAFGFIPIVIPVRDFAAGTVPSMALKALSSKNMAFDDGDQGFFARLLEGGGFLVILDGLNESGGDSDVLDYALTKANVRILITSQTSPQRGDWIKYELPPVRSIFAKDLLRLLLGKPRAQATIDSSPELWDRVESAYDVRLVADLVNRGKPVPSGRLELFQAMMNDAGSVSKDKSLEPSICRLAWDLWKKGERRFSATPGVPIEWLGVLRESNVVVIRGDQFEFRHDLMRGYLAASWATLHAPSIAVVLNRLSEQDIWNLSVTDQDAVFPFLARLVRSELALQSIFSFASELPEIRTRLLVAVIDVANKNGWSPQLKVQQ
jgi:hypothetical protein